MKQVYYLVYLLGISNYVNSSIIKKFNKVGNLNMSPIGIGTWAWGNRLLWNYKQDDDKELNDAYDYALQQGVCGSISYMSSL